MTDNFYLFKRLYQVGSVKHMYEQGERPPYPIIIEAPVLRDVIANMGVGEFMPFLVSIPLGAWLSYSMTSSLKPYPFTRRRMFTTTWMTVSIFALWLGFKGSFYKLIGFEDNGLKWKTSNQKIKKYVFTNELSGPIEDAIMRKDFDSSRVY